MVCFTSDHDASFADLPPARVAHGAGRLADRTAELSALPGVEQVFCFENRGRGDRRHAAPPARADLRLPVRHAAHPGDAAAAARAPRRAPAGNLFADVLAAERAAGTRVVAANEHWTAFVPAAARWPFEVHLAPHRQVPDLPALTDAERDAFGAALPRPAAPLRRPVRRARCRTSRPGTRRRYASTATSAYLHLQLFSIRRAAGKLKYLAGSESAMGVFINDIAPEQAAELLRRAV